jgi:hypothetical protein
MIKRLLFVASFSVLSLAVSAIAALEGSQKVVRPFGICCTYAVGVCGTGEVCCKGKNALPCDTSMEKYCTAQSNCQ